MLVPLIRFLALALGTLAACAAYAQILPRIPPAPPPATEYVPPPPPKPVEPPPPPKPEAEIPSLVVRDADGNLKQYPTSLEEAAIRATDFPPEKQKVIDAVLAARNVDLEKWAVANLEKVKTAMAARGDLDNLKDFNQLFRAKEAANAIQQDNVLDRLVREGAITVLLRTRVDRAVHEYQDAQRSDWEKATGTDIMKIAGMVGRQSFVDQTRDVFAALGRLMDRAAPALKDDAAKISPPLSPAQSGLLESVANADAARAYILDTLTTEQASSLLSHHLPAQTK